MSQEETYKPTSEDQAIYANLITGQVRNDILQAHIQGKIDQETYDQLFKVATQADREVKKIVDMLGTKELDATPAMSDEEVNTTVKALLKELPASYPPYIFSKSEKGYWLEIERRIIFRGASGEDAIKHTQNYVEARKRSPNLPIGVIYGIYD